MPDTPYDQLLAHMRTAQGAIQAQRDAAQQIAQQAAANKLAPSPPSGGSDGAPTGA